MNRKTEEKKIIQALFVALLAIAMAYFFGKDIAQFCKEKDSTSSHVEVKIS